MTPAESADPDREHPPSIEDKLEDWILLTSRQADNSVPKHALISVVFGGPGSGKTAALVDLVHAGSFTHGANRPSIEILIPSKDNEEILDRFARLDGFDSFFRESYPRLLRRLVLLCGGDRSLAEDIAQEALLLAYRHWDRLSRTSHPYAWVRTTAIRLGWQLRKKQFRHAPGHRLELLDIPDEALADVPVLVDIQRALRRLPRRQREVATLRIVFELEPTEIAEILGIAAGTARAHLHAARTALLAMLDPTREGPQS